MLRLSCSWRATGGQPDHEGDRLSDQLLGSFLRRFLAGTFGERLDLVTDALMLLVALLT